MSVGHRPSGVRHSPVRSRSVRGRHHRVARGARPGVPALDGVRALAVVAVLVDHGGVAGAHGGFVGVDVFFVLSGFLITSLLLAEQRRTDRIDLAGFWTRRARRLLPALAVMVVAVGLGREFFPPDAVAGLRGDGVAAFLWVANWRFIAQQTDYFAQGGTPSPLQHTWSLGVEEQYYLLWPLLLIALAWLIAVMTVGHRRRAGAPGILRWAVFALAASGAAASAIEAIILASDGPIERVYFGTDTRAQALLIGAAASALLVRDWPPTATEPAPVRSQWGRSALRVLPFAGLAGLAAAVHWATGSAVEFRYGLLTGVALAAIALIVSVTLDQQGAVARVLASRPLVWLGGVSYGVYLWHWPAFLVLNGERTGWSGFPLFVLRCVLTLALATASWWLIEGPIRRWRPVPGRLLPAAGVSVAAAVALMVVVVPVGTSPGEAVASDLPPGVSETALAPLPRQSEALPVSPGVSTPPAQSDPARPRTVAVFGDSIAWTLMRYLPSTPGFDFIDHTQLGCGLVRGGPYRYFGQTSEQRPECDTWTSTWAAQIAEDRPDVVLLLVGRWETMDRLHDGRWTQIGDPAFDTYLSDELHRAFEVLGATGAQIVVATEPYNRRGEQSDGSLYPEDQPERVTRWNTLLRQAVAQRPHTTLLDLNKKLGPDGVYTSSVEGIHVRSDGVHLTPDGVSWLAPWLVSSLR